MLRTGTGDRGSEGGARDPSWGAVTRSQATLLHRGTQTLGHGPLSPGHMRAGTLQEHARTHFLISQIPCSTTWKQL